MVQTAARPSRPGVRFAVAGSSLVLLLLVSAYLVVTLRYDLTSGSFGSHAGSYQTVTAGDVTEYRYLAQPGRTVEYAFSIANRGPLPVRLEQVIVYNGPYAIESVRIVTDLEAGFGPDKAVPFRPVDLRRNHEIVVWISMRLFDAAAPPENACAPAFGFGTQRVHFRVLGMPREQDVPMGFSIKAVIPGAGGQPCEE